MFRSTRLALIVALLALGVTAPTASSATGAGLPPNPVVQGPVYGGIHARPMFASLFPMQANGYLEEEYFLSGTARSLATGAAAPYTTRIVVRRPANPAKFNGTLVAEWVNVTGSQDLEAIYPSVGPQIIRDGYAWATVSAQIVGVSSGPLSLKGWDPVRYAPLVHPGDTFSMDIFAQALQAMRSPGQNRHTALSTAPVDPMGGLRVKELIATGGSQSASRLTTYISDGYPVAGLIDGFLITRGGGPYPKTFTTPTIQLVEENLTQPQPDSAHYRFWIEAGIAHAPQDWYDYVWASNQRDTGTPPILQPLNAACSMNQGTSRYTHRAALAALQRWVTRGTPAPAGPKLSYDAAGDIVRDADGLAKGGIRLPFIEAPLAMNSSGGCPLFGTSIAWSAEQVLKRYPTRAAYVAKVDAAAARAVKGGFLLDYDAAQIRAEARALDVWTTGSCWDTAHAGTREQGPLSSQTHPLAYQVPLGGGPVVHDASCALSSLGG